MAWMKGAGEGRRERGGRGSGGEEDEGGRRERAEGKCWP